MSWLWNNSRFQGCMFFELLTDLNKSTKCNGNEWTCTCDLILGSTNYLIRVLRLLKKVIGHWDVQHSSCYFYLFLSTWGLNLTRSLICFCFWQDVIHIWVRPGRGRYWEILVLSFSCFYFYSTALFLPLVARLLIVSHLLKRLSWIDLSEVTQQSHDYPSFTSASILARNEMKASSKIITGHSSWRKQVTVWNERLISGTSLVEN